MSNKTQESLDKMFTQSRLFKQRQRQKEKERRKKEKLQLKKAKQLMQKTLQKIKQVEEEKEKKKQEKIERKKLYSSYYYFKLWRTNLIERETTEDDLYNTWDEIKEAEERNEGKLNWTALQRIINDTKTMLNQSI